MARKFLDKDGLTALWAKIVDKINSIGDNFVKKTGDIITGSLYIKGYDLVLDTTSSSSNDSADIRWQYGNAKEKARVWTADNPTTAADGRLNFRVYKEDGTSLYSGKLATASDIDSRVAKTGDTMSGNLYVAHAEPVFVSKITSVDASKSNNNVSSTRYPGFTVLDNSSRILTRNEAVISSDGNIKNYLYVRNYNTSGAQVAQKGLSFSMNKSGALTWAVDDAANFRTAIGLGYEAYNTTACLSANNMTALQFIKVVKIGAMVTVNYHFSSNPGKSQSDPAWCALKAGLRPNRTVYFTQHAIGTNINDNCKLVAIYSDGTIKMPNISGSSVVTQCMGCFTFCTV